MQASAREEEAAHRAEVPTSRMQSRYWVVSMSDRTYVPTQRPVRVRCQSYHHHGNPARRPGSVRLSEIKGPQCALKVVVGAFS